MPKISDYETLNSLTGTEKLIVSTDSDTKTVTAKTLQSHTHQQSDVTGLTEKLTELEAGIETAVPKNPELHPNGFAALPYDDRALIKVKDYAGNPETFLSLFSIPTQNGRWHVGSYFSHDRLGFIYVPRNYSTEAHTQYFIEKNGEVTVAQATGDLPGELPSF